MILATTLEEVQDFVQSSKKQGKKVGFVPTMGALHKGHLSLIEEAKAVSDVLVASIFVNPTQFNDMSDLDNYPRTLDLDSEKLRESGCDLIFSPNAETIYPEEHVPKRIDYQGLDLVMEGAKRPGHFDGVVEVVAKLFDIVSPDVACFGEKDFQQLAVIRLLVEQHEYPIQIIGCSIIREPHGLAMSSRNERLDPDLRAQAAILYSTLTEMRGLVEFMNPDEVEEWGREKLMEMTFCELEYIEVAESRTLQPIFRWHECDSARAFVAARFGETRLIDNLELYTRSSSA